MEMHLMIFFLFLWKKTELPRRKDRKITNTHPKSRHNIKANASRLLLRIRCRPRTFELKHRGECLPIGNEIIGEFGPSILLSYSGIVVSYIIRKEFSFFRLLPSRIAVKSQVKPRSHLAEHFSRLLTIEIKSMIVNNLKPIEMMKMQCVTININIYGCFFFWLYENSSRTFYGHSANEAIYSLGFIRQNENSFREIRRLFKILIGWYRVLFNWND